mmetsp:Transcript_26139/g.60377  ORF Transcript_26139/g.60377 Transcript_26139/m.60377 type:complete len:408 (+) Transcript_26139:72-1295(+)
MCHSARLSTPTGCAAALAAASLVVACIALMMWKRSDHFFWHTRIKTRGPKESWHTNNTNGGPRKLGPIIWLHLPKCGSQFATTLAHFACGDKFSGQLPYGLQLYNVYDEYGLNMSSCYIDGMVHNSTKWRLSQTLKGDPNDDRSKVCATAAWQEVCGTDKFYLFRARHQPLWRPTLDTHERKVTYLGTVPLTSAGGGFGAISNVSDDHLRHVVTMLRAPAQRVVSGWIDGKHDCRSATTQDRYQRCVSSCQTFMIVGAHCSDFENHLVKPPPSILQLDPDKMLELALWRLKQFGFFGITDDWDNSICLFHTMYGGDCLEVEFARGRTGPSSLKHRRHGSKAGSRNASGLYDLTSHGFTEYVPGLDDRLLELAKVVYKERLSEYGVTVESCAKHICPKAAGHLSFGGG